MLLAPAADVCLARTLTNLSTAERIRCFEALAAKPVGWLVKDTDGAVAYRRWMIVAAGGHAELISRFTDFLEAAADKLRPQTYTPPKVTLFDLLATYALVLDGR